MRISDWSSDVCSSDLLADPAQVDGLIPAVIEKFGRAPDLLVNNAALFAEGEWTDLSAAALAEMMQVNLSAPVMLAKTLVAASERSEEHTSELQSLMRISYAVFCLKKKQKTSAHH